MTLLDHARRELGLVNEDPELSANLLAVVAAFAAFGHSGGSAPIAIHHLERLLRFQPLSPLTSDPAEWIDRTEANGGQPMWQSTRDPRVFSHDGGRTWAYITDDYEYVPPAAQDLPKELLDSATRGASMLEASAATPATRNLLAHALIQLGRDGWLNLEPHGETGEPLAKHS